MLNWTLTELSKLNAAKFNPMFAAQMATEATDIYAAGWNNLLDGIVVMQRGNKVVVKDGNEAVELEMLDFRVRNGKLDGNIKQEISRKTVTEELKNKYLAQTIITKYYTMPTM